MGNQSETSVPQGGTDLQNYAVHLYTTVRVKVVGIKATSIAEAVQMAESTVELGPLLENANPRETNIECVEWDEGPTCFFLVDTVNDGGDIIEGSVSHYLDGDGSPMIDNKTAVERKAAAADEATKFMKELLDSVETLGSIAEEYGVRTLSDLMYLQAAILEGGFIDHCWPESTVMEIVSSLPSGEIWTTYIKQDQSKRSTPVGA